MEAYAIGDSRGAEIFRQIGDVDTAASVLTLDDGTLAMVSNTRYNGRGYDVRLELHGSTDSIAVGLEDRPPPRSVEPGAAAFPAGPPHAFFLDRFADAFRAELAAFLDVVAARRPSLHGGGRSEDSAGRRGLRPLADRGPAGADRRGPPSTGTPVTGRPGPP